MKSGDIPVLDLSAEVDSLWPELQEAISEVLRSGQFIMGPNVKAFETEVAQYLGARHAVAVNSGTDALFIALRTLGIGPGDEVIVPTFTFFATAEAVSHVGATPVAVDVNPRTFTLDTSAVERAITNRTKAIIPVHLYGHSADMDRLLAVARGHGLKIVEDVAQAFGGTYRGQKLGTLGDVGAFSFFPTKNLGAYGDGGLLVTNDDTVAMLARKLRAHGSTEKYHNELVGYNSRLDELQAAILRIKLRHVDQWNANRRQVACWYEELLSGTPGLTTPCELENVKHVYHQYTLRIAESRRGRVQRELSSRGISTMIYYPIPIHRLPVYNMNITMPVSEALSQEVLSLPIWPQITRSTVESVALAVRFAMEQG